MQQRLEFSDAVGHAEHFAVRRRSGQHSVVADTQHRTGCYADKIGVGTQGCA